MKIYTMQHIPTSSVDRMLKDIITESEHFLVVEIHKDNRDKSLLKNLK